MTAGKFIRSADGLRSGAEDDAPELTLPPSASGYKLNMSTIRFAGYGFDLSPIDFSPAMIRKRGRGVGGSSGTSLSAHSGQASDG